MLTEIIRRNSFLISEQEPRGDKDDSRFWTAIEGYYGDTPVVNESFSTSKDWYQPMLV